MDGVSEQADVVVANILAEVIVRFAEDAAKVVKPGGYFITSGIIQKKRQEVIEVLTKCGFKIEETMLMEDWVAIIAKRM